MPHPWWDLNTYFTGIIVQDHMIQVLLSREKNKPTFSIFGVFPIRSPYFRPTIYSQNIVGLNYALQIMAILLYFDTQKVSSYQPNPGFINIANKTL